MIQAAYNIASVARDAFFIVSKVSFSIYVAGTLLPRTIESAKMVSGYFLDWFKYATAPLHDVITEPQQLRLYDFSIWPILTQSHTNINYIDGRYIADLYSGIVNDSNPIVSTIGKAVLKMAAVEQGFALDFTSYLGWYLHNLNHDHVNTMGSACSKSNSNYARFILQNKQSVYIYNDEGSSGYHNQIAIVPGVNTAYSKMAIKVELVREHTAQLMQVLFHNYASPYSYEHGNAYKYNAAVREVLKKIAFVGSVSLNDNLDSMDNMALAHIIVNKAVLRDDSIRYILDSYISADNQKQADIEMISKFAALHAGQGLNAEEEATLRPIADYWEQEVEPRLAEYTKDYTNALLAYHDNIEQDVTNGVQSFEMSPAIMGDGSYYE